MAIGDMAGQQAVAVLGLGRMGLALATALIAAGHRVSVWNRSPEKAEALKHGGAEVAATPSDAIRNTETALLCITGEVASEALLKSPDVVRAFEGRVLIQLSTLSPATSAGLAAWAGSHRIAYLDGAILGYPDDVLKGRCVVVYSGDRRAFEGNEAMLAAIGRSKYVGEKPGGAPAFEQAMFSFSFASWAAYFHGGALCRAAGIPLELYVETLIERLPSRQAAMQQFGRNMIERDYAKPDADIDTYAAAFAETVKLSEGLGVEADLPKLVQRYFERAIAAGHGKHGFPALIEVMGKKTD